MQVKVEYDSDYDILYFLVGEPTAAYADPLIKDVYIRRDMFTERIAGVIIEDYSKKDKDHLSYILPMNLGEYLPSI